MLSTRSVIVLAGLLAMLVFWDQRLTGHRIESRDEAIRIGSVFDASILEERRLAAIGLQTADAAVLYAFDPSGFWRVLQANGAPARRSEIETILPRIAQARGVIRSTDPASAADYGIGTRDMLQLTLHGEGVLEDADGDPLYVLEIGHPVRETGGSYVRIDGNEAIWEVDFNLRDVLQPDPVSSLPPMLDTGLIPEAWSGSREGIERIRIERPDLPSIEIFVGETDAAPDRQLLIGHGDEVFPADPARAAAYAMFLTRVGYLGLLDPAERSKFGFDDARGEITLHPNSGDALRLIFGQPTAGGNLPVFNSFTRIGYEISSDLHDLFLPRIESLRGSDDSNPWESW